MEEKQIIRDLMEVLEYQNNVVDGLCSHIKALQGSDAHPTLQEHIAAQEKSNSLVNKYIDTLGKKYTALTGVESSLED